MAYIPAQKDNPGLFIATTNVWDVEDIAKMEPGSIDFNELLVRLHQNINNIAVALNMKKSGQYLQEEFVDGSVYFGTASSSQLDLRPVFRKVINIGALGAGATSVAHGLTIATTWNFTRIYGAASNTTTSNYYPLPWASAGGAANIELKVDANNVVITNNSGIAFLTCTVVLEYLKN